MYMINPSTIYSYHCAIHYQKLQTVFTFPHGIRAWFEPSIILLCRPYHVSRPRVFVQSGRQYQPYQSHWRNNTYSSYHRPQIEWSKFHPMGEVSAHLPPRKRKRRIHHGMVHSLKGRSHPRKMEFGEWLGHVLAPQDDDDIGENFYVLWELKKYEMLWKRHFPMWISDFGVGEDNWQC